MTARLYATVYAPDDLPTETAHIASKSLGTVNEASELEYKKHLRGTGSLKISISRHHTQAALLQQDRYIIVHSAEGPVGGGFLENGIIDLSSDKGPGGEFITWTGRGPLAILERAVMDADSNITGGEDPIDGYWDLSNQGPLAGDSNGHPIPMLKRALVEAQLLSPNPIPEVDHSSWTYDADTASAAVPFWDGENGVDVGDDLLSLIAQFDQLGGVIFQMDHLFNLTAHLSYGTDLSGAFGAGTVRFEKGVNVAASIQRKVRGAVHITHLVVGGADRTFTTAVDPDYVAGDVVRWGFLAVPEVTDLDALEDAGLAHISARKRQTDAWSFPLHDHGDTPASGVYEPTDHFDVGDTVSYHTGSGEYDANEQSAPVAAITWALKTGDEANGDYAVTVDIGSTFVWDGQDAFAGDVPGSQHRVLFCQAGVAAVAEVLVDYEDAQWGEQNGNSEIAEPIVHSAGGVVTDWFDAQTNGDNQTGEIQCRVPGSPTNGQTFACFAEINTGVTGSGYITAVPGTTYVFTVIHGAFSGTYRIRVAWISNVFAETLISTNDIMPTTVVPNGWQTEGKRFTAPPGTVAMEIRKDDGTGLGVSTRFDRIRIQTVESAAVPATAGDGHADLVGEGTRAARCGHGHDVHRDTAPSVNDDETLGYHVGTIWARLDSLATPTAIVGEWLLADASAGAAIWLAKPSGGAGGAAVGCRVFHTAAQSIPTSTNTVLLFNSEAYDTDGIHSTASLTGRFVVPAGTGGKWRSTAAIFVPAGSAQFQGKLRVNGVEQEPAFRFNQHASLSITLIIDATLSLSAGDYVEFVLLQASGGPISVGNSSVGNAQNYAEFIYEGS